MTTFSNGHLTAIAAPKLDGWLARGSLVSVGAGSSAPDLPGVVIPAAWQAATLGASGMIGPVSAQVAIVCGAAVAYQSDGSLLVGGKTLIGPAGKTYAFESAASAAVWVDNGKAAALAELSMLAAFDAAMVTAWKTGKSAKLAVIAARVVDAAAKQTDASRLAALLAESNFCFAKWA